MIEKEFHNHRAAMGQFLAKLHKDDFVRPPICPLRFIEAAPLWAEINSIFEQHGCGKPDWRLRDTLVNHLSWAQYGQACAAALRSATRCPACWGSGEEHQPDGKGGSVVVSCSVCVPGQEAVR